MALSPTTGWAVLHLFCRLQPDFDANALHKAVSAAEADGYQVVPAALLGHKGDLGLMVLGLDVWRLRQFQTEAAAAGLSIVESYFSLTEVSEYAAGIPDEMRQARLFPQLPPAGMAAFCFYPMSKRRGLEAPRATTGTASPSRPARSSCSGTARWAARSTGASSRSSPVRPGSTTTSGA